MPWSASWSVRCNGTHLFPPPCTCPSPRGAVAGLPVRRVHGSLRTPFPRGTLPRSQTERKGTRSSIEPGTVSDPTRRTFGSLRPTRASKGRGNEGREGVVLVLARHRSAARIHGDVRESSPRGGGDLRRRVRAEGGTWRGEGEIRGALEDASDLVDGTGGARSTKPTLGWSGRLTMESVFFSVRETAGRRVENKILRLDDSVRKGVRERGRVGK